MRSFHDYYLELSGQLAEHYAIDCVAEMAPTFSPVDERLVQCIWTEQLVHAERLATVSGLPLKVIRAGEWNTGPGPDFLNAAGRKRLETKTRRLQEQLRGESFEQAFYQSLMTTMGQRGGKALYFLLAKRTPIVELRDFLNDAPPQNRAILLEAIFLHVAGLTPDADRRAKLDGEECAHLARLEELWRLVEGYFSGADAQGGEEPGQVLDGGFYGR